MSESRHSLPNKNIPNKNLLGGYNAADVANDPSVVHVADWAADSFQSVMPSTDGGSEQLTSGDDLFAIYKCFDVLERVWPSADEVPQVAGPYTLEEEIGRGGMGRVWSASQSEPIKRRVAVKLINPGPQSRRMVARFESERNVLAMMNHPGIATIIEAGKADDGQLYFAMELVEGPDLVEYCDRRQLKIEERLSLFLEACSAVQHAHQKGIIHRDLKPGNILVGQVDGQPRLKIIDFGLSKSELPPPLIDAEADTVEISNHRHATNDGQVIGSVRYMSPEQAGGEVDRIDIRSDVYSLGVVLYKLLVDSIPLDQDCLKEAPVEQVLDAIRRKASELPSKRIASATPERLNSILRHRKAEAASLRRVLKDDLDWIVMKAIAKKPEDRYATVSEFAADVRRFLGHEVVSSRPDSRWYAARKSFVRNRVVWSSALGICVALLVGALLSVIGLIRATKAESLAESRLVQSRKSTEILADIFSELNVRAIEAPTEPFKVAVGKRLVNAASRLGDDTVGDARETIQLQIKLANALIGLEMFDDAIPVCRDAFEACKTIEGSAGLEMSAGKTLVHALTGAAKTSDAEEILEPLLEKSRATQNENAENYLDLMLLKGMIASTNFERLTARQSFETVVEGREQLYGNDDLRTLDAKHWLSKHYTENGVADAALEMLKEVAESARRAYPKGHPGTVEAILSYAWALSDSGELAAGLALAEEGLEMAKGTFGNDHPITYDGMLTVGLLVHRNGDFESGAQLLEQAWDGLSQTTGLDHPRAITARIVLAQMSQRVGDLKRAISLLEESLALSKRDRGIEVRLAELYVEVGEYEKARLLLEVAMANPVGDPGGREPQLTRAASLRWVGNAYAGEERYDEAIEALKESSEILRTTGDRYDFRGMRTELGLARCLSRQGNYELGLSVIESYVDEMPESMGPMNRLRLCAAAEAGGIYRRAGRTDEAISKYELVLDSGVRLKGNKLLIKELRLARIAKGLDETVMQDVEGELRFIRQSLPAGSIQLATELRQLGYDLVEFGQKARACELLEDSAELLAQIEADSWMTLMTKFDAAVLSLESKDNEADSQRAIQSAVDLESSWFQLLSKFEAAFPVERRALSSAAESVIKIYTGSGDEKNANVWKQRLEALSQ